MYGQTFLRHMLINMRQVTLLKSLSKLTIYSILDK